MWLHEVFSAFDWAEISWNSLHLIANIFLSLSLTESVIETFRWFWHLSLWTKSYSVTIQMKPLQQYFHMTLFIFQYFTNEIWDSSWILILGTWEWKGEEDLFRKLSWNVSLANRAEIHHVIAPLDKKLYFTLSLSTQEYKMGTSNILLGCKGLASHPGRSSNTLSCFMLQKPG